MKYSLHVTTRRRGVSRWLGTGLLLVSLLVPLTTARAQLPSLGDGSSLTLSAERRMGAKIARELYRDPDYIDDAVLSDYVQGIWQPLLAAARSRGELTPEMDQRFAWTVLLGKDKTVNAFALPGGYLGLNLGLIAVVSNRDELASVLGHELSHVTQRHIARLMAQQGKTTPLMIAAMILGVLAASKSADVAGALVTGGQAAAIQSQLNFSRDMEREADRIGYGVMTQAGFKAQGFVTMFDKLQQASRINDNGSFPYLRSHPMTTERMADMMARNQLITPPPPSPMTMEHAMMVARARVLSDTSVDALRARVTEVNASGLAAQSPARQAGAMYAAVLAQMKLRDYPAATALYDRLTALSATDPAGARIARWLGAELALAAGRPADADTKVTLASQERPEMLLAAQTGLAQGQPARLSAVVDRLQTWVALHPDDAAAWQWLSQTYQTQGQTLRQIRAGAEAQVAVMDYAAAADRLKAAQSRLQQGSPADYIDASIIDTRLRAIESLLREQALER